MSSSDPGSGGGDGSSGDRGGSGSCRRGTRATHDRATLAYLIKNTKVYSVHGAT